MIRFASLFFAAAIFAVLATPVLGQAALIVA